MWYNDRKAFIAVYYLNYGGNMVEEVEEEEKKLDRFTKTITILGILGTIMWAPSKFIIILGGYHGLSGLDNVLLYSLILHFAGLLLLLSALFAAALLGKKLPSQVRLGILIAFALIILSESFPWMPYYYRYYY